MQGSNPLGFVGHHLPVVLVKTSVQLDGSVDVLKDTERPTHFSSDGTVQMINDVPQVLLDLVKLAFDVRLLQLEGNRAGKGWERHRELRQIPRVDEGEVLSDRSLCIANYPVELST